MVLVASIGVMMLFTPIMARVSGSGQQTQESNSEWFCFYLGLGPGMHARTRLDRGRFEVSTS